MRIHVSSVPARPAFVAVAGITALLLAGCSNGPTLKGPSWNLTGSRNAVPTASPQTAITPPAPQPAYRGGRDPVTGRAQTEGAPSPAIAAAPAPQPPHTPPVAAPQVRTAAVTPPPMPVVQPTPPAQPMATASGGRPQVVEVKQGDSLAKIAAEHKVSIASLMQANKLRDPYISPGQWLVMPRR